MGQGPLPKGPLRANGVNVLWQENANRAIKIARLEGLAVSYDVHRSGIGYGDFESIETPVAKHGQQIEV